MSSWFLVALGAAVVVGALVMGAGQGVFSAGGPSLSPMSQTSFEKGVGGSGFYAPEATAPGAVPNNSFSPWPAGGPGGGMGTSGYGGMGQMMGGGMMGGGMMEGGMMGGGPWGGMR